MKSVKTISLVLLAIAVAIIAGVLIGVHTIVSESPLPPPATNVLAAAPAYPDVHSFDPMTNAAAPAPAPLPGYPAQPSGTPAAPEPVPAMLPPIGQMPMQRLVPLQPRSRPTTFAPAIVAAGHRPIPILGAQRQGLDDLFAAARERMVQEQLIGRGLTDPAVIHAMRTVPRQAFVPALQLSNAYVDMTINFSYGRVLETPFVIATAARQLAARPGDRVLEVNAAPGYATAVYSMLVKEVFATQFLYAESLAVDLQNHGFTNNVFVRNANPAQGWPEAAPFDTIVFNGPVAQISEDLLAQLKPGGRLIIPVTDDGNLCILQKSGAQLSVQTKIPVRPTPIPGNEVPVPFIPAIRLAPPPH